MHLYLCSRCLVFRHLGECPIPDRTSESVRSAVTSRKLKTAFATIRAGFKSSVQPISRYAARTCEASYCVHSTGPACRSCRRGGTGPAARLLWIAQRSPFLLARSAKTNGCAAVICCLAGDTLDSEGGGGAPDRAEHTVMFPRRCNTQNLDTEHSITISPGFTAFAARTTDVERLVEVVCVLVRVV